MINKQAVLHYEAAVAIEASPTEDWEKAIVELDHAIRLDPQFGQAYLLRAEVYQSFGENYELDLVLNDYDEAIFLGINHSYVHHNRGVAESELGQYRDALIDFNEAIRLDPFNASAYNNRPVCYRELGDLKRSEEEYNKAVSLDPELGPDPDEDNEV